MQWTKHGWGSDLSPNYDPLLEYYVDVSNIVASSNSLLSITSRVIREIKENYPAPYHLMLSGGIDSQLMLWCWYQSGVDFHPVSVRYKHDNVYFNDHDLERIQEFSKYIDVSLDYTEIKIIDFLENKLNDYATKYICTSPQICTHMYMSELYPEGTVIFSGDFFQRFRNYSFNQLGLLRYAQISQRSIIPFFYMHDRELAGKFSAPNKHPDQYISKFLAYVEEGAPLLPQNKKYTGFEALKEYYDNQINRVSTLDRLRFSSMPSKRAFDLLFRYKLMDRIKYKDTVVILPRVVSLTSNYRGFDTNPWGDN